ncbi:hypothetical protein ACJJTC_017255 [Scirpophaga incertulas]
MGRSRFPGKPLKFQNRKRISVLSGTIYHESTPESHPPARGGSTNDFVGEKEEEEKKENNNDPNRTSDHEVTNNIIIQDIDKCDVLPHNINKSDLKSPVRTRSQNKMEPTKDKPKPVKKTVTFGTVESCEDMFLPLKKIPKHHAPLVPIIKKKSSLKPAEYSSILKPAKLTDLSSKSSLDHHEGYLRKNFNPLSKPMNKFSQLNESRCVSPPPKNSFSLLDKDSGIVNKFVLPVRSAHSSRVIKPNKRFIEGEEHTSTTSSVSSGKVLKKPKLKRLVFNNLHVPDDDSPEEKSEKSDGQEKANDKNTIISSNLFKTSKSFSGLPLVSSARKPVHDFFSYEKESDLHTHSQDDNSNLENLDKLKTSSASKEDRSGHSLRKLMDISDASSSSSTSSESDSEDHSESDSQDGSGDEEDRQRAQSPEKEKSSASQLFRGKVIIREARLQLNSPAQSTSGLDGPFSTLTSLSTNNPPTTVTCGVCGAVRFYRFVKQARKFGIYSCESCRKFISKMLKKEKMSHRTGPVQMQCLKGEGNCQVPPIVRSQQWKLLKCTNKTRCPACWLKLCLKAFQVPPNIRTSLTALLPPYMRGGMVSTSPLKLASPLRMGTANVALEKPVFALNDSENNMFTTMTTAKKPTEEVVKIEEKIMKEPPKEEETPVEDINANKKRRLTRVKVRKKDKIESKQTEDPKRQKVELKGPRVKHVCRSASIVLGQPIATFPTHEEKEKSDKIPQMAEGNSLVTNDKIEMTEVSSREPETEIENKVTHIDKQVIPEIVIAKDSDVEMQIEIKKRKIEPVKTQAKAESSEDETAMELVPRKMTLKPLMNITNVRSRAQKCGQNRPELICVDFWESYDPDEVCSSGFGLIGTASFTVSRLCFLCGSAGKENMVVCSSCCEWYHGWCAEDAVGGRGWTCARCASCAACGRPAARRRCRSCAAPHHATCLPAPPSDHRRDWPQICSACLKCKSCDSSRVNKFVGSLPFCGPCFKLRQKGNYCPLCQACYRDNDFDSKMMECGWCGRWVHASCEGLSGEGYQLLSALPPSIEYICCKCMPHDPPWRKMLTEHLKNRLLHLLKLLAKNKKACALLKLTPHKNTPVPNKPFRIMSPQAIRKLHFDGTDDSMKNTTETKVYRNTARGRRNANQNKSDEPTSLQNIWQCSSLLSDVDMEKEDIPQPSHKVVNLQEPLMQNKEICFSTGLFGSKTDFDAPCVEVHENYPPQNKAETKATTMLPTTIHDDKYDAISDDDEPMKTFSQARSEQDLSPAITRQSSSSLENFAEIRMVSPSLLDVKKRVNSDEYVSLKDFNHDMKAVIERTLSGDLKMIYKELFSETFPWFDCENNCLQPNLEVEGEQDDADSLKDSEMSDSKIKTTVSTVQKPLDQIVPKQESDGLKLEEELLEFYPVVDSRICILCKSVGDGLPSMEGRLLYCGQNDWIHSNCALWSAEVFEEIDGSLQNVHSAISRGKMIKCAACELKGASVGCCAKNCSETYHYACARNENCAFLDDKRVFCSQHGKDIPVRSLQKDSDFELTRPVYVELDKKKKRYSEINKVQFILGSLIVNSLGKIVPSVSDYEEFLMPVDFSCTRLFWSCKKPSKIVRYTIKTKLILAEPLPGFDFGVNITVDHSRETHIVERVMAEIGAWHENLETGSNKAIMMLKSDKSPIKYGNTVTLEDLAVKHVVEFLLDSVCKQEQQDDEEPQNTADLFPPEVKDAIFEDLNHDLLDGISMQDIFQDLKNEFYCAMSQSDDRSNDKSDFIDELLNARLESGSKELKRSKSEMLLQNHSLKTLTTGRGQQRSSSLTWNNKFDTSLLSSTIKRCKIGKSSTVTGKLSPVQRAVLLENSLEIIKETENGNIEKKLKTETATSNSLCNEVPHTSGINYRTTSPKQKEQSTTEKSDKSEGYYTDVIDFYTKIQCSPIAQLDGTADWSGSESTCSSRPDSPRNNEVEFSPISQLDGADDNHNGGDNAQRNQSNQFLYRASGTESTYTVTIAGNSISGQPELVMRPLDDNSVNSGQIEQLVKCDRCQCTYRNKESYDRHIPTCDMMSTSESESENPKSPENKTLTTLQNAFQGAFAQPMIIHAGVVSGTDSTVKAESISARRTSINTRQITINGTIVETPSPGPANEMTMTITEQMKTGTVIFDQSKTTNVQVSSSQQVLSSPQIVVTPQMLLPPKTSSAGGQKLLAPQIITQPGLLPYNICVKPGSGNASIQQIQSNTDMAQLLSSSGGIQVISSNSNQVLAIPANQSANIAPMIQGKNQVTNFPNMASASSIALPVNSMANTSIIQNIQPMIRPQIQGNPTIVVPAMTAQRLTSTNTPHKQQILIPAATQKSPKKPTPVQPKPIFQAGTRARGRAIPKPAIKRQTKLEKTFTTINPSPLGPGNTVIQLQTNNQTGQPSIIVQPVTNQNIMSAYVEALSQQQNQNMQYIATIGPQGDFKPGPTQFISQSGLVPQTFQIQQTESGGLVAVPSGSIPVLLPQGNVGILPQTIQQGATILPQGAIQTQGILSQGPNGPTILPQAIHTQNGATLIPQGTIQGLGPGNLTSQTATLLPNNTLQSATATVVPQSGNGQTIIPNALSTQGNTLISTAPGTTILPQGTLLPQFCNDQVLLGSTPTLEMVTDPSGCMYLTATQPVYYGLETIVQNTVMSSQQFVSTAMQGVLAQNSSFSATTTQVFQASKIEPIVEVPTGYVVVNNVGENVTQVVSSAPNIVTGQSIQSSPQTIKNVKTTIPNLTLQPLPDKSSTTNRQTPKVVQMTPAPIAICSQSTPGPMLTGRQSINPITSQIHTMTLSSPIQNLQRATISKSNNVSMTPSVTLVSSIGQPVMAISQSVPNTPASFSMQSIPLSQPIVSSSIAPSMNKNNIKIENSHVIEISGNLHENSSTPSVPTISVTQSIKSPTPWRQISTPITTNGNTETKLEIQNMTVKTSNVNSSTMAHQNNIPGRHNTNEVEKINQNCLMSLPNSNNGITNMNLHSHQFDTGMHVSHHSAVQSTANNVIQITAGNIYPPSSIMNSNFDPDTTLKLSKINALSKAEGGHLNFSQEIMASHSQQNAQNDKVFQNLGTNESKHNTDNISSQMNIHKLNSCQVAGNLNNPAINIIPHNNNNSAMRSQMQNNQNSMSIANNQGQICSMANSASHNQIQLMNSGGTMQNIHLSCQEATNSRVNMTSNNESNIQPNIQHDMTSNPINNSSLPHGNMQIIPHDNPLSSQNSIHIMSGQIQHNRSIENNQHHNSSTNRSFHENIMNVQQSHNQTNLMSNRSTPDNNNLLNQSMNMHGMGTNHNLNRNDINDLNHMHLQQPMSNMNNMQNNRMIMENMSTHNVNNTGHQMHSSRAIDNMHNTQLHNMQQINHHMNSNSRQQIDIHVNQQMGLQQNRQMDVGHHHQHQMPNIMQMQNNRNIMDSNLMSMHQHVPNQMHNRQQLDNTMHMHHISGNSGINLGNLDTGNSISSLHNNRHDSNMAMQNMNAMNQIQNARSSIERSSIMQHQINNMNSMNNMNMHGNMSAAMQMNNTNHQSMNNSLMHVPSIPDIKNDIQNSCSGSCSNNGPQFSNNQNAYDMQCTNLNPPNNMNMASGNMIHGMNMNSGSLSNNMMMNSVSNSNMYSSTSQNINNHDILMGCNNSTDHNINNILPNNSNHMIINTQSHSNNNQNQMLNQVTGTSQINMNSCNMAANNVNQNQINNLDSQLNRNSMTINDTSKFNSETIRGKNIMSSPSNNISMTNITNNNDCAKVSMIANEKTNHMTVNDQIGYMQMNSQNNRIINLPERNRINNTNIETNVNQHVAQQHNIHVVTNNNTNNVTGMTAESLTFQQKNDNNSTMINVPFQAIPNSAPMNINVNSSNNTVNITVQNNLVDPKIASKTAADINFPIQASTSMLQNQNNAGNMICIPVQNNTINLPTQTSSSITLPKAPPTQQSGIPTNVVNPMSMRPMNRVLPLHRDGQSKSKCSSKNPNIQKHRQVVHDMPDLNVKEENIDSDLAKAIEESKRMMELEQAKREKEDQDISRSIQLSTDINNANANVGITETIQESSITQPISKINTLPSLDAEMSEVPPKALAEKDTNRNTLNAKVTNSTSKVMKRPFSDKKSECESVLIKKQSKTAKGQENKTSPPKLVPDPSKDDGPKLIYEVISEDGFSYSSSSLTDLWAKVVEAVQITRKQSGLPLINYNLPSSLSGAHLLGLNNNALRYLVEQLPGASRCTKYKIRQGRQLNSWDNDLDLSEGFKESPWGSARTGPIVRKSNHDMFSWMASPFREEPPPFGGQEGESSISRRLATLPLAMRFRQLKETSKISVGVYRSHIHGRGLFCKRDIEEGDMVIEYAGEVIRAVLADQREKRYEAMSGRRGVGGCYMFRIDDNLVVDATLKGNAARFINHSCDPNCYSRVVDIHGHKHILIFALRRITIGEELTYDYKFPFEEVKIPCTCGAKKCRKYLN